MNLADPAAERGVLAGLCMYGTEAYLDVADIVSAGAFAIGANQVIFRCLEHILKDKQVGKVDFPTIMSAANVLGLTSQFEKTDDLQHLRGIMRMELQQESVRKLAARVRKLEITRDLKNSVIRGIDQDLENVTGDESLEHILGLAENPICDFATRMAGGHTAGPVLMGEGAAAYFQYLLDNPREMMGIPTPFGRFNAAIGGGLRANCVDLIGARQKGGKTFLVDNVALHIAGTLGIPVLNVDTEMNKEEHLIRVGACLADLPSDLIGQGKLSKEDRQKLMEAAATLETFPYHYDCVIGMEFEDILARIRRWALRTVGLGSDGKVKPCVVLYDYLKLLDTTHLRNNIAEHQLLRFIASALKNFMGRFGVSCLAFAQLNRDGIDYEDTRVIRGSDGILDAITSFSIFKWKPDDERAASSVEARKYSHKLIPLICRHGPGLRDGDYINMKADYTKAKITEGPTKTQLDASVSTNTQAGFVVGDTKQDKVDFGA